MSSLLPPGFGSLSPTLFTRRDVGIPFRFLFISSNTAGGEDARTEQFFWALPKFQNWNMAKNAGGEGRDLNTMPLCLFRGGKSWWVKSKYLFFSTLLPSSSEKHAKRQKKTFSILVTKSTSFSLTDVDQKGEREGKKRRVQIAKMCMSYVVVHMLLYTFVIWRRSKSLQVWEEDGGRGKRRKFDLRTGSEMYVRRIPELRGMKKKGFS